MTSFSVSGSDTSGKTLKSGETGTITSTGNLHPSGVAVTWDTTSSIAGTATIANSGILTSTGGRAIDSSSSNATSAQSLSITNNANATMSAASDFARIQKALNGGSITIANSGTISGGTGRGINVQEYTGLASFSYSGNGSGSTFQSTGDVIRITSQASPGSAYSGTVTINNSGTIKSTGTGSSGGQALDLDDVKETIAGNIHITNQSTGLMQAADADAIRTGANALIDNYGKIEAKFASGTGNASSNDGIDAQANAGVVINNYQGAQIIGARHGITGDLAQTITNDGTITGNQGAGVNLDTLSDTSTITNNAHGVITGNATSTTDGDAIDVDYLVNVTNHGMIQALGSFTGGDGLNEALAIGGGTVVNDGTIYSDQRAITVDNSNLGGAFGALNLTNNGTITGSNGEAIHITGTQADTITNNATITGSVFTDDGNDTVTNNGAINGNVDLGAGNDVYNGAGGGGVNGTISGDEGGDSFSIAGTANVSGYIDGGAGTDSLSVDDTGFANGYSYYMSSNGAGGFTGTFYRDGGPLGFYNIENLSLIASDGDDYVQADIAPVGAGATLSLNGGEGSDTLSADFSALSNETFTVGGGGTISSTYGSFANFETFTLYLGGGSNSVITGDGADQIVDSNSVASANDINTGAGNDIITAYGIDSIDGGADNDTLYAHYESATAGLSLSFGGTSGALSNGTSYSNIEYAQVLTGSGDDTFTKTSDANVYIDGGAGADSLTVNDAGLTGGHSYYISSNGAGAFSGTFYNPDGAVSFGNIETLHVVAGDDDNYAQIDVAPVGAGVSVSLDGGAGSDTLSADFSALSNEIFTVGGGGSISSTYGSFANFETFTLYLGGGANHVMTGNGADQVIDSDSVASNNSINTGAGDDIVTAYGVDTINGGADFDSLYAHYESSTADLSFSFGGTSGTISNGTSYSNIEYAQILTGSGDDTFTKTSDANVYLDGGAGTNSLTVDDTGLSGGHSYYINSNGTGAFGGTFYNPIGAVSFNNIETLNVTGGSDDNYFQVDASASLLGGALHLNDSGGDDTVAVNGSYAGYSITQDGLGGYVITDTDASDGSYGSFTTKNIEHVHFFDQTIDLAAYGNGESWTGSPNADSHNGTDFTDTLSGLAGNDTIDGLDGNDTIDGGLGDDVLDGGNGVDELTYASSLKPVKVDLGLDTVQNTGTGSGKDIIHNFENLVGSDYADVLKGNDFANHIDGGAAADKLYGFGDADTLLGGDGADQLWGGSGADLLDGGTGTDKLYGEAGNDILLGGDGADSLDGGSGADAMTGGLGSDKYWVDDAGDTVSELSVIDPGTGKEIGGVDWVYSSIDYRLDPNVEKLALLDGFGNLNGMGNELKNTIFGNNGDNILNGGANADILTGGAGADSFVFDMLETSAQHDTVKDFVSGTDKIDLSVSAFSGLSGYGLGTLDDGELTFGTKATAANQHLIYNSTSGALFYDADGAGGAVQIQIATLTGHPALAAHDITLIG